MGETRVIVEGISLGGEKKDSYRLRMNTTEASCLDIDLNVYIKPKQQMEATVITDIPEQESVGSLSNSALAATSSNIVDWGMGNMKLRNEVIYDGKEWYVIGLNGQGINSQNGTMTLLSKKNWSETSFNTIESNEYNGSLLQQKMVAYYENLNPGEQAMILPRDVLDGMAYDETTDTHSGTLSGTHYIWPLSKEEAEKINSSICGSTSGRNTYSLTRTAIANGSSHIYGIGYYGKVDGELLAHTSGGKYERPALTLNLANVLFASDNESDKPTVGSGLYTVTPPPKLSNSP